jgi:hypothetical protein
LNNEKKTKRSIIIATTTVTVVIVSAAVMILGIQIQTLHNVLAQSAKSNTTRTAANTPLRVPQANQLTRHSG